MPVGYPTEAQRAAGYTGSAIGIHGPHRILAAIPALGTLASAFDTTKGCIGPATDAEVLQLSRWLEAHPTADIVIE